MKTVLLVCLLVLSGCGSTKPFYPDNNTKFYTSGLVIEEQPILKVVKSAPRPTVIIAHGCDGTSNKSYQDWLLEVSNWGYNGIMIDSFQPRGFPNVCYPGPHVPPEIRSYDIKNIVDYVKKQSWHNGKIALIGFSHGGSTVLNFANNDRVSGIVAAVAYYPSCRTSRFNFIGRNWESPLIPVQVHFGSKDTWTPPEECGDMKNYETYTYKGATHAFDMNFPTRTAYGYYMEYNPSADRLSRVRTKEFLDKHLKY
jgi:dienelactone hydrolase